MIDAFIIRSYKDEAHEVAQGLAMGLKDANGKKKTAYNVFKNMDSSNSLKYTEKVLKSQVGNWKSLIPGYSTGKISSMYRKWYNWQTGLILKIDVILKMYKIVTN